MEDYEDASASKCNDQLEIQSVYAAIADGATESAFAADWAKIFVRAYVKEPFTNIPDLQLRTEQLSKRWQSIVQRRPLPWFAEEKVRMGAFSTLLGVQIVEDSKNANQTGNWSAIVIGDSCLFQVRGNSLIESFPISRPSDFGNAPTLLSSNLSKNKTVWNKVTLKSADWRAGDMFLLLTDALALWFLSQHELNEHPWKILIGFVEDNNPAESFTAWVEKERASSKLKNDDVTLVCIKL